MSAKDEWEARWENVQQLITFATDVGQAEGQSSATTEPRPEDLELSVNSKSPLSTTIVAKKQDHEVIDLTLDDDEDNAADGGEQEQGEEDLTSGYEHLASIPPYLRNLYSLWCQQDPHILYGSSWRLQCSQQTPNPRRPKIMNL